ncbi:MAG: bifunctional proline dehydrogenase/L-glutamate gamma-semialdehyde dehydrogenase PutA, partial [bacterium]
DWASHVGDSGSILVNASTWALMLTGRVLDEESDGVAGVLQSMLRRMGEPVIRVAVERAMREMGEQFVLGQDIAEATDNGNEMIVQGYTYSYDMLGEAARTDPDAMKYHAAYASAIEYIAGRANSDDLRDNPGISIKLSALHPRYEASQKYHMLPDMCARLLELAQKAKVAGVGLNIDAEEADRLDLSLDVIAQVLKDQSLADWDGFGVVVQAYGPRAGYLIDWLYDLACTLDRKIMVRLVKGAYWDTEIKRSQVMGLPGFPVFTRKVCTDVSYIACASQLLGMRDRIYPQFATHNAHTIASVLKLADGQLDSFEFQRLHGMGDALHDIVLRAEKVRCRIYAPVGTHEDLLAYLVRRLLENGANSSFVNQIVDLDIAPEEIAQDPLDELDSYEDVVNPRIARPEALYGPERRNSTGWDINDPLMKRDLTEMRAPFLAPYAWKINREAKVEELLNPSDASDVVGTIKNIQGTEVDDLVVTAISAHKTWASLEVSKRKELLLRAAEKYEEHAGEFFALLAREAGKTLIDAIAELREAVDFLRYYAINAESVEINTHSRGAIVCISPWNFPLAIFSGQIGAALVTGNSVLAKPAEQTPLVAVKAIDLMHEAGIPQDVLQLLPGPGETVGAALTAHPGISGVCFTGSTEVAKLIDRQLAQTAAPDAMLIAETGGLNAMIVDSTALLEQAVEDIVEGAFRSAGQRCSALRILYVQSEIRERLLTMLFGAMDALIIGDPLDISTDVGPIIDQESKQNIEDYCRCKSEQGKLLYEVNVPATGNFISPVAIEVDSVASMEREVFGPVLHVASFESNRIETVIEEINDSGYGLTFGLHTRIDNRVQETVNVTRVGNLYVNRNQIGAIVGSQPFGGEGLSGTGPKAGGPHYLRRFRLAAGKDAGKRTATTHISGDLEWLTNSVHSLAAVSPLPVHESVSKLRSVLRGKAADTMSACASIDSGPIDLPGPTGESNQLILHPLGTVLCVSDIPANLICFVVQALRMGNRVIAVGADAGRELKQILESFPQLCATSSSLSPEWLTDLNIDAVAADYTQPLSEVRRALANRPGPIIRLITEQSNPAAFATERAICIDTTAAGGNAALLAESG